MIYWSLLRQAAFREIESSLDSWEKKYTNLTKLSSHHITWSFCKLYLPKLSTKKMIILSHYKAAITPALLRITRIYYQQKSKNITFKLLKYLIFIFILSIRQSIISTLHILIKGLWKRVLHQIKTKIIITMRLLNNWKKFV